MKKEYKNELGQIVGMPVLHKLTRQTPYFDKLTGTYCTMEVLDVEKHSEDLYDAYVKDSHNLNWTYLPYGPFKSFDVYQQWLIDYCLSNDPLFYVITDKETSKAIGVASFVNIRPTEGVIEVAHINYSPALQKTILATEATFLMMQHVFNDLGYRRYEWKCDFLNEASRSAAARYGFQFEGVFRQDRIVKGRNRDTALYSIVDTEWPLLQSAYEQWLSADNFDADFGQKKSLQDIRTEINLASSA